MKGAKMQEQVMRSTRKRHNIIAMAGQVKAIITMAEERVVCTALDMNSVAILTSTVMSAVVMDDQFTEDQGNVIKSKFTNEDSLQEMFGKFGPVEKIQIIRDPNEGRSRGYAFINMVNVADAQAARDATTGTILHDRKVRVDFSITTKPPRENGGRFSEGRGRNEYRNQRSHQDTRRYDHGSFSHRFQPYSADNDGPYGRRRPNTRDRRRRDEPLRRYQPRDNDRQWARSKSPGFHRASMRADHDIYRGSYGQEKQRYGNGAGSRRDERERQHDRGRSQSRGRAPRGGEYIPAPASTRPPPPY
ncbi:transformer 2 beta [Coemansia sp. RSA 2607]|nr:transformer 2 beta [Coemansia sp. RSA 2607]